MKRGTTKMTADRFSRKSRQSRPATSGNKNVMARRKPQAHPAGRIMGRTSPIVGPDRGTG